MLKVECESCKAPYQIDERRVPPTGLKMRCPKCGHSFLVTNPGAAPPPPPAKPAAPPKTTVMTGGGQPGPPAKPPPVPAAAKKTMVGVAPPTAQPPRPPPAPISPPTAPAMRAALPSDFPAALGSLDEVDLPLVRADSEAPRPAAPVKKALAFGDVDLDLPIVASDLPAAKPAAPRGGGGGGSFDIDLPARTADLPARVADLPVARRGGGGMADLPVVSAALPVAAGNLPVVSAGLPVAAASLPVAAASLPVAAASLPVPAAGLPVTAAGLPMNASALPVTAQVLPVARGFGEIDLPNVTESLPSVPGAQRGSAPPRFGEVDLPGEQAGSSPPAGGAHNSADFGDLELGEKAKPRTTGGSPASFPPGASAVSRHDPSSAAEGGMTFGEVDFGGGDGGVGAGAPAIGVDRSTSRASEAPGGPNVRAAATTSVRPGPGPREAGGRPALLPKKRPIGKLVVGGIIILLVLAGGALQLTTYGAFGYLAIGDTMHAKDYAQATAATMQDAEKTMGLDTYDVAKSAGDAAVAAHARTPRARPLTAYAAVVDAMTTVRFGPDGSRASPGKRLVSELPKDEAVKYLDVATAAVAAADGDLDKARKGLDAASKRDTSDPIQLDVALLRGGIELTAKDPAAALLAFKRALELSNDARAHYGLARAYDLGGDAANARKELDATLALSPLHPGALVLRARMKSGPVDPAQAQADLAKVIDGPARAKASPTELSRAYAAKAWVSLERGAASDAREAFGQAVKLDPRNIEALNGEGRLLLNEGRFTEALARFDTALSNDPASPETIANDAEAKIALERLADAKQQLLDAKQKFPKNLAVLMLLGKVEHHLGNNDAAEADLRAAVSFVDPQKSDAVLPYVALSELLSARGRMSDATAALDEAKKKLPASAALDRAFGEVAELQGEYDGAVQDYKSALLKDPKDVATHFHLAVVLRRVRKFEDARAELDTVAAVDKDYPGLALERGLLFEESGDVEKAIEQFKSALSRAPDDPDLQLRVGSAYVVIGRPDDALPMLRKVLEKRPTSAEAHHYIGRALMLRGPSEQVDALRYLKRAVDLDPNRAEFHVYLAWAANDAQPAQLEVARDEVGKALALDKLNAEAYWQRGVLERMEGAIDDAVKDERHALTLRPSRYEAHATLAECFEDKNDDATAAAEWAKAIAGDGNATNADGTVPHPFWRYRYGKLLSEHGNAGAALALLLPATLAAEKMSQRPGWQGPAEFLTAEALRKAGRNKEAVEHYRRYLEIAPVNSPDRADAQAALARLAPR
jgi:cellulose synthase operon protein C